MANLNEGAFINLVKLLQKNEALAFIGAGLSVDAGYPTWTGLLDELHENVMQKQPPPERPQYLSQLKTMDDLTWRAEEYKRLLSGDTFNAILSEIFRPNDRLIGKGIEAFSRLPFKHILTTNYDTALELGLARCKKQFEIVDWSDREGIRVFLRALSQQDAPHYLVYLHGRYADPSKVVLTERDYVARYVVSDDASKKLFAIFATQPVVFIGFSLTDPDLSFLMRVVNAHLGAAIAQHFIILPLKDGEDYQVISNKLKGKYGIEPVFYKYTDNHAFLPLTLELLREAVEGSADGTTAEVSRKLNEVNEIRENVSYDPRKGEWGGSPKENDLELSAHVITTEHPGWFKFELLVQPTKPDRKFEGKVIFHLHPTFRPDEVTKPVLNGVARYENLAYGAFTVGAEIIETDGRTTKLELDLAALESAPLAFRLN